MAHKMYLLKRKMSAINARQTTMWGRSGQEDIEFGAPEGGTTAHMSAKC